MLINLRKKLLLIEEKIISLLEKKRNINTINISIQNIFQIPISNIEKINLIDKYKKIMNFHINEIDVHILSLILDRLNIGIDIANSKFSSIKEKINNNSSDVNIMKEITFQSIEDNIINDLLKKQFHDSVKDIMIQIYEVILFPYTKLIQLNTLKKMVIRKIFYLGPEMTFSYNVAITIANKLCNKYELYKCINFIDLYSQIKNGNYVVIPYKNTNIGYICYELYKKSNFNIIDTIRLPINLYIAYSGNIKDSKILYTNKYTYNECNKYLPEFIQRHQIIFTNSNSESAIKCMNNNSFCITNKESIEYYNLNEYQKIDIPNNYTDFLIVTNK